MRLNPAPFRRWFPLTRAGLRADAAAGLAVGAMCVPQAMAYAQLAGMPPWYGLYAAIVPAIVGALFGWCGQIQTGPVAMTSILTAGVLAPLAVAGSERYIELAILLCLLVGLVRLGLGLLRGSFLVSFISHPVIAGFAAAAGIIIGGSQCHELFGLPAPRTGSFLGDLRLILAGIGDAHLPTAAFAAGSIGALLLLRRWRAFPAALTVLAAATALSAAVGFSGRTVGAIPMGPPPLTVPAWDWHDVRTLLPGAMLVTVIGFLEVLAVTRAAAARTREPVDLDQELIGQGAAAVAGSFAGSFPVSGSLSRSAVNLAAGARTGLSAVITGLFVLAALLVAAPLLSALPLAVLAAITVMAVIALIDVPAIRRAWRIHPHDGIAGAATAVITLLLAPNLVGGFLAGVLIAIGLLFARIMHPRLVVLARHADGTWRDARRHGLAASASVVMIRLDSRLTFVNAARVEDRILAVLAGHPGMRGLILAGDGINEIDATGEDLLRRVHERLGEQGIRFSLCGLKAPIADALRRSGLLDRIGDGNVHRTEDAAYAAMQERCGLRSATSDYSI